MRLQILVDGHRPLQRIVLRMFGWVSGDGHPPGPVAAMSYRRGFFGKELAACVQEAMRRPTEWTTGEVELFAAFVSRINECEY